MGKKKDVFECDFEEKSWAWREDWIGMVSENAEIATVISVEPREEATEEERREIASLRLEAMRETRRLADKQIAMCAEVISNIPRAWLLKETPEEVDWANPDNLKRYVRVDCVSRVIGGVTDALVENQKN